MLKQELTRGQAIATVAILLVCVGLLIWGAARVRSGAQGVARPVEMAPVTGEVPPGAAEPAVRRTTGVPGEDARRQEVLQNLKAQALDGVHDK